jgi:hypothetical protein
MDANSRMSGFQQLLAAEQEAQQIVYAARTGEDPCSIEVLFSFVLSPVPFEDLVALGVCCFWLKVLPRQCSGFGPL